MLAINDISYYLKGSRILIIDDCQSFQRLISEILRKAGVTSVIVASTLEEGMQHLNYNHDCKVPVLNFDMILMDINLPDGNGIEGCKFIASHEATNDVPVVVISGDHTTKSIQDAFNAGASDYLQKPVITDMLKMRLGLLLKLRVLELRCT